VPEGQTLRRIPSGSDGDPTGGVVRLDVVSTGRLLARCGPT
jgi:hypothetical protein